MNHLWNGIRYRWRKTSHRLSWLGTGFASDRHELTLKIGRFPPDIADYTTWFVRLPEMEDVTVVSGIAVGLQPRGIIGQTARARTTVHVSSEALSHQGLSGPDIHGVAVLGGFRVRSVGNRSGWHFGRLALDLGPLYRGSEGLAFDVEVTLRPSEAPEFFHLGNRGWSYDLPCIYDVEVDWVVILGAPEVLSIEPRHWETEVHRGITVERTEELRIGCPPGVAPARCPAVGLQRFDIEVDAIARQRRLSRALRYHTGRNIRELGLWVEMEHDDESGVSLIRPGVAFSNRAAFGWMLPLGMLLCVVSAVVGGVLWGGTMGGLLIALGVAVAGFALAWPGGPLALPSVPWSMRAAIECSLLYLPGTALAHAGSVTAVHRERSDPHESVAPL